MAYKITSYTLKKAKELNVAVKPSTQKNKKIDVFSLKDGKKIVSIGAIGYGDFPTFSKTDPKVAEEKRRLYHLRHQHNKGPAGFYAKNLLW